MALTLTVGGTDRTSVLVADSLHIEQTANSFVATCDFDLVDTGNAITVTPKAVVTAVEDSETLFAGLVADVDYMPVANNSAGGRLIHVVCQDYNILVEEAVIDETETYTSQSDSAILADLFSTYRADINATTYVSTLDADMDITFEDCTLREALKTLCELTGGQWYVDSSKNLHYFSAESNVASWTLSGTPNYSTSFPYYSIKRSLRAATIVNSVFCVGDGITAWRQDATSIATYGERQAVVVDHRITDLATLQARGDVVLDKWAYPREVYTIRIAKTGLRAGMDLTVVCAAWSLNDTRTVTRLTMSWENGTRYYDLEWGTAEDAALIGGRLWLDKVLQIDNQVAAIDGTVFDTDAPSTPVFEAANLTSGVSVDADGHQIVYVQVTWAAVSDADLDYYDIELSTSSDFSSYVMAQQQKAGGNRTVRFYGVVGNTTYYARVRAVDWVGNASDWSTTRNVTTAKDTTAPAQVSGLSAAGARTLIGLTWTRNTEADLSHYVIERSPTGSGSWTTLGTAKLDYFIDRGFTEAQIQAGTTFYYRVSAVDTSGNTGTASSVASASLSALGSDSIAANAIVASKIAADAVTAEKIDVSQLSAISADMGTITAGTVTGATIRTAASGQRVQMDSSNGLIVYNSSGQTVFQIGVTGAGQIGRSDLYPIIWNAAGQLNKIDVNQITVGPGGFNVLTNSAFLHDDNADEVPDDWTLTGTAANYNIDVTSGTYVIGGWCWGLVLTTGNSNGQYRGIYQNVTLASAGLAVGDDFVLSGYVRVAAVSNATIKLYVNWLDSGSSLLQQDTAASLTAVSSWTRYTVTNTIPATAVTARVVCIATLTADGGTCTAYWDAIQLERGDLPTQWKPGLIGNVNIDATRILITDGTDKMFLGKSGTDLGMFGYDGATLQVAWYAAGTNAGKIVAGAGAANLDASGVWVTPYTAKDDVHAFRFKDGDGSIGGLYGVHSGTVIQLDVWPYLASHDAQTTVRAQASSTYQAKAGLWVQSGAENAQFLLSADDNADHKILYAEFYNVPLFISEDDPPDNDKMTLGLTIDQGAADDEALALKSSDVAHGITDTAETDTYGAVAKTEATSGGLQITGLKDADGIACLALNLRGYLGEAADTTKSTGGGGVINLTAAVKSGTGLADVGADGNLVTIQNRSTTRFIFDAEGCAHGDVEWIAFSEHDDLALLDKLEATVVSREFGGWVDANRRELEALNIAHFDDRPGHAMLNLTRLSMLLTGALRQVGRRLNTLETRLLEG